MTPLREKMIRVMDLRNLAYQSRETLTKIPSPLDILEEKHAKKGGQIR